MWIGDVIIIIACPLSKKSDESTLARFFFHISSSGEGFADLLADQTDIVMSTREISTTERKLAREAGMGDLTQLGRARVLALDALVAIVQIKTQLKPSAFWSFLKFILGSSKIGKSSVHKRPQLRPICEILKPVRGRLRCSGFCSKKTKHLEAKHGFQLITLICHSACLSTLSGSGLSGVQRRWTPKSLHSQDPVAAL